MESVGISFGCIAWIVVGRFGGLTVAIVFGIFLWSRGVENLSVVLWYTVFVLKILSVILLC